MNPIQLQKMGLALISLELLFWLAIFNIAKIRVAGSPPCDQFTKFAMPCFCDIKILIPKIKGTNNG